MLNFVGVPLKIEYFRDHILTVNRNGQQTRWEPVDLLPRNRTRRIVQNSRRRRVLQNHRPRFRQIRVQSPQTRARQNHTNRNVRVNVRNERGYRAPVTEAVAQPPALEIGRAEREARARRRSMERNQYFDAQRPEYEQQARALSKVIEIRLRNLQENQIQNINANLQVKLTKDVENLAVAFEQLFWEPIATADAIDFADTFTQLYEIPIATDCKFFFLRNIHSIK